MAESDRRYGSLEALAEGMDPNGPEQQHAKRSVELMSGLSEQFRQAFYEVTDTAWLVAREMRFKGIEPHCDLAQLTRLVLEREAEKQRMHYMRSGL